MHLLHRPPHSPLNRLIVDRSGAPEGAEGSPYVPKFVVSYKRLEVPQCNTENSISLTMISGATPQEVGGLSLKGAHCREGWECVRHSGVRGVHVCAKTPPPSPPP